MSVEGKLVNELTTTTPAINDIALGTELASPTVLKRSTWQAVYNLFKGLLDTAYNSTYARLTGGNTFSGTQTVSLSSGTGISVSSTATGLAHHGLSINTANLGNANGLLVYDNSNRSTLPFPLVEIDQDNASSTSTCVKIKNDGTGSALDLTGVFTVNGQNWTSAWTSYTPVRAGGITVSGFTTNSASFSSNGKRCTFQLFIGFTATSTGSSITITAPVSIPTGKHYPLSTWQGGGVTTHQAYADSNGLIFESSFVSGTAYAIMIGGTIEIA